MHSASRQARTATAAIAAGEKLGLLGTSIAGDVLLDSTDKEDVWELGDVDSGLSVVEVDEDSTFACLTGGSRLVPSGFSTA